MPPETTCRWRGSTARPKTMSLWPRTEASGRSCAGPAAGKGSTGGARGARGAAGTAARGPRLAASRGVLSGERQPCRPVCWPEKRWVASWLGSASPPVATGAAGAGAGVWGAAVPWPSAGGCSVHLRTGPGASRLGQQWEGGMGSWRQGNNAAAAYSPCTLRARLHTPRARLHTPRAPKDCKCQCMTNQCSAAHHPWI